MVALAALALASGWGIHSHNDYAQPKPFYAAWEAGAVSIEADVFLVDGDLKVAHDRKDIKPSRNLRSMYLEPLLKELPKSNRRVLLLVDIKENGTAVLPVLLKQIAPLSRYLTTVRDGKRTERQLLIVASGDRPVAEIQALNPRTVFVDGRLSNGTPEPADPNLAPLISDSWTGQFKWTRANGISLSDQAKLAEITYRTHKNGQILRFWATPDDPNFYPVLANAGVDLIGTDFLTRLAAFRDRQ